MRAAPGHPGGIPDEAEGGDQTMRLPDGNHAAKQDCAGDAHKALVRRFVEEAINQGNLDVVADVCAAPDFGSRRAVGGPESIRELLALYRGAVPDACWTVEQQVAEGDTVVTRFTARGTQQGALLGLAPTRQPMVVPGLLISRCRDGKFAVEWAQADLLGLLQQLGVMPHLELDKAVAVAQVLRAGTLLDDPACDIAL
jgi:predicted ester cyclase